MKKVLCLILSMSIFVGAFCTSSMSVYAKEKYYEQKSQYNSQAYLQENFSNNYYVRSLSGKFYVYDKLGGKLKKKISLNGDYFCESFAIRGKYIYYVNRSNNGIYRVGVNGKNRKKLVSIPKTTNKYDYYATLIIAKDKVFYILEKINMDGKSMNISLNMVNLDGSNKKKIDSLTEYEKIYSNGNYLYYLKGKKLAVYNIKTGKKKTVSASKNLSKYCVINMQGNVLYLAKYNKNYECCVYKMSVKDKKIKKITKFIFSSCDNDNAYLPVPRILVYNDVTYITTAQNHGCRIASVGKNGKLNYKKYRKKYYYLNYIGFYKGSIIGEDFYKDTDKYVDKIYKVKRLITIDK